MGRIYKLFTAPRIVFYCIYVLIGTSVFHSALAAGAADSVFTVQGVEVDVTADNAAAAREQAFAQAQKAAFQQLANRLLPDSQQSAFKVPDVSVISSMVNDFEITNEKLSDVRYIGTYTFRFKNDAVRNYLGRQGYAYADVGSKPLLVLPFYEPGAKTVLWGETNPWLAAWSKARTYQGLVPVIVPIGDAQDIADISDREAMNYKPENLANMTQRYGAGEAVIMIAAPQWSDNRSAYTDMPDSLIVTIYHTRSGRPEYADKITVTEASAWNASDIFAAAVQQSRNALQQAWKSQTTTTAAESNKLKVRVKFATMREWIETQKKLRYVQGVNDVKLLSLTQNEANVELQFQGTQERLRLALTQADMTLSSPRGGYYGGYNNRSSAASYDLYLNKYASP